MKTLIRLLTIATVSTSISISASALTLECENRGRNDSPSQSDMTLVAQVKSEKMLTSIKMTSTVSGLLSGNPDEYTEGFQNVAVANPNYKPRKFTESNQFTLDLKVAKGSPFGNPLSECQLIVMLPKNLRSLTNKVSFNVPMLVHCDQSGGREDLTCQLN
jgi:hypothetical protein